MFDGSELAESAHFGPTLQTGLPQKYGNSADSVGKYSTAETYNPSIYGNSANSAKQLEDYDFTSFLLNIWQLGRLESA